MAPTHLDTLKQQLHTWLHQLGVELPFAKISSFITAFTHPSYKGMVPTAEDYERYEFLGDSVLDLIAADSLFNDPSLSEEDMTEQRKLLVSNDSLAPFFDCLSIDRFTRTAINYSPSLKDKANLVEAFFGALFTEFGYKKCQTVWTQFQFSLNANQKLKPQKSKDHNSSSLNENLLRTSTDETSPNFGIKLKNAKSVLQEFCQKRNLSLPEYFLDYKSGPDHDPLYQVEVTIVLHDPPSILEADGDGKREGIAEMKSAEALCDKLGLDYIPS
ncbi:ribonuclease III family protein [Candidatus Lokiarchaeum ossiferum]|uniref:ribonuclease III family protein n=1 Tax=Candidatus Lokiarchaeum ossiferum TaxID=2951803 RepID=UPI00352EBC03